MKTDNNRREWSDENGNFFVEYGHGDYASTMTFTNMYGTETSITRRFTTAKRLDQFEAKRETRFAEHIGPMPEDNVQ